jgi:ribosomal protein S18 acetylase RimI-like enzyme
MRSEDEIRESNGLWVDWARMRCRGMAGAEVLELPGWSVAWGGRDVAFYNTVFLSEPVRSLRDFEERVGVLEEFLRSKAEQPRVVICRDWVAEEWRGESERLLGELGLRAKVWSRGMVAEELPPAARELPALEYRRVGDEDTRNALADINGVAHGFPQATARETMAKVEGDDYFGFVGYIDGTAVAAAAAMPLNGCLHLLRVATLPEHRRRGYGEAVTRRAVEVASETTGLKRTTLHTTKAGFEMYRKMGYRAVAEFEGWG